MAKKTSSAANLGFEDRFWQAAEKLRGNLDAAEYEHVRFAVHYGQTPTECEGGI